MIPLLRGLEGGDEAEGHGADEVGVEDLDGGDGGVGQAHEQAEEHGEALGVVDGGVDEEDLAQVVPHDAVLLHGVHDGGEVVVDQDHLGGLAGDVRPLLAHGDAHVGSLERGGVVHAVVRHAGHLPLGLEGLHDADLVLG